ncbi:MAG: N-acetylmuramoyl-L-alanine amidase [Acidobacteria bacterium]|nr:N-acetylmuramoyl-L-alanine amidase [Acidobacteriota bacterium]
MSRRRAWCALALVALLLAATAAAAQEPPPSPAEEAPEFEPGPRVAGLTDSLELDAGIRVIIEDGRRIALSVTPDKGEDYASLARRLCGSDEKAPALASANGGRAPEAPIEVPWDLLREEYRYLALRALFPADRFAAGAWEHVPSAARALVYGEGLWQVALWFTGDGERWQAVGQANGFAGPDLPRDRAVRIPAQLLLPLFRPVAKSADGTLEYVERDGQAFAVYRLRRGEALYSGVVLRFTEMVRPDDVLAASETIARASAIADVTKIPAGARILVPLELLAPRHLPANHPRQVAARIQESELAQTAVPAPPPTLAGVHVLLDPGHGGDDVGARNSRIWESDYVYDVACRVKRLLEREPGVTVHMLARDTKRGFAVSDRTKLAQAKSVVLQTTPPHRNRRGRSTVMGVNLRWYLANSIFRRLTTKEKVAPGKVVFISLHADSLHKSVSGGMVYVPGERYRRGSYGVNSAAYKRYQEWREAPTVSFTRAERLRDEATSRLLAREILAGYREHDLPVHEQDPVRDHIVRGTKRPRPWAPAILRGNAVPAKVLLETLNINNHEDARLLEAPDGRERLARAVVSGLRRFFDS